MYVYPFRRMTCIGTVVFIFIIVTLSMCSRNQHIIEIDRDIRLKPLTDNVWIHVSDIEMPQWGKVSANGLVAYSENRLMIIDTPWNNAQTELLVRWFRGHFTVDDIRVIVTHYHDDNLGGLDWIHGDGIESYAIAKTIRICREKGLPVPRHSLAEACTLHCGKTPIEVFFPGEGHTVDSISVYLPRQRILFGGCSVKALEHSNLGNTAEANVIAWPDTLRHLKRRFADAAVVVPGHGMEGTVALIDHTLSLFD